jgi:hypothetical protein
LPGKATGDIGGGLWQTSTEIPFCGIDESCAKHTQEYNACLPSAYHFHPYNGLFVVKNIILRPKIAPF